MAIHSHFRRQKVTLESGFNVYWCLFGLLREANLFSKVYVSFSVSEKGNQKETENPGNEVEVK